MKTIYAICSTVRTGSSLLCEYLTGTELAGTPVDYLNKMRLQAFIPDQKPYKRLTVSTLENLIGTYSSSNGVFGIKLPHLVMNALPIISTLRKIDNANLYFVYVTRLDEVKRAISAVRSRATGAYYSFQEEGKVPEFSKRTIDAAMRKIKVTDDMWKNFFANNEIEPLTVTYEDLISSPETVVASVLDYIGVKHPKKVVLKETRLHKQSDGISSEWENKYKNLNK